MCYFEEIPSYKKLTELIYINWEQILNLLNDISSQNWAYDENARQYTGNQML